MGEGWIKLFRKSLQSDWWRDYKTAHLFNTILLLCNHEDRYWRGHHVRRGECITSFRRLAEISGLSIRNVRSAIYKLEVTHQLTRRSTHQLTQISVCNYERYQASSFSSDTRIDTQIDNKQEEKKKRRKEVIGGNVKFSNGEMAPDNSPDAPHTLTRFQHGPLKPRGASGLVWLTDPQYGALCENLTAECVEFLIRRLETWADEAPKKFKVKKRHARVISDWHRAKVGDGFVFSAAHPEGAGYYRPWIIEKLVGAKCRQQSQ